MNNILFKSVDIYSNGLVVDFIRGIAVLLVFIAHADAYGMVTIWPFYYPPIKLYIGRLGVAIFFILSGFLIWHSALKNFEKNSLRTYITNRITRILPLYIACIIFVSVLSGFFIGQYQPNVTMENVLWHLIFSQHYVDVSRSINPVLWTLTHEATFYAIVPVLLLSRSFSPLLCALSIPIAAFLWSTNNNALIFIKFWPLFAVGILIAHYKASLRKRFAFLLLVAGICFSLSTNNHYGSFFVATALVMFLIHASDRHIAFGLKPIAWLGIISYSIYIWHYLIIELLSPYIIKYNVLSDNHLARGSIFCAIVILFSYASYKLIEYPFMTSVRLKILNLLSNHQFKIKHPAEAG